LTVIGAASAIPGAHVSSVLTIAAIVLLIASMLFGFFAYGYVVNSFRSPVELGDYKNGVATELADVKEFKLAGSDALLVKTGQFKSIRICTFVQFLTMLAGAASFIIGLAGQVGI